MTKKELKKKWSREISEKIIGRKIVGVRYMTDSEVKGNLWHNAAVVLTLDNGTGIYPMSDEEGNNAGAIATTDDDLPVIPVI